MTSRADHEKDPAYGLKLRLWWAEISG